MSKNENLILITSSYPFGLDEAFIEYEITYLVKAFKKVVIIMDGQEATVKRTTPHHFIIRRFQYLPSTLEKAWSLKYLLAADFWEEFWFMTRSLRLSPSQARITSILTSLLKGHQLKKQCLRIATSEGLDLTRTTVYSYWCNDMAVGISLLKRSMDQVKAVVRCHGYDVYFEENTINYLPLRRLIYQNVDQCHFVSKDGLNYATKTAGSYESQKVSYLGTPAIDSDRRKGMNESVRFTIMTCSTVKPVKQLHLLIPALAQLEFNCRWIHIGSGPELDHLRQLAELAFSSLANITASFQGQLTTSEILNLYESESISLFVNVSRSEGIPVSIMEAMSHGIPVIAPKIRGIPEIVKNGLNGFLLPHKLTPPIITTAIQEFYDLPFERKDELGRNAWTTWNTDFNDTVNFPSFVDSIIWTAS